MKTTQLFDRFLQKIVLICEILLAFFVAVTMIKAFYSYPDAEFLNRTQSKTMLIFLAGSMAVFLFLILRQIYYLLAKANETVLFIICVSIPVLMLAGQLVFLIYYRSLYMWDSAYVVGAASSLLSQHKVAGEALYYLSIYPNQNMFTVMTEALLWFGQLFGMNGSEQILLCNAFNMISLDVAIGFALLIVRRIHPTMSRHKWAFLWVILSLQPFFYMGVSYYYTITLSMPWFMAFLYLSLNLFLPKYREEDFVFDDTLQGNDKTKKIVCSLLKAVAAGLCFTVGYLFRATTIIPLVAVLFSMFLLPVHAAVKDREQFRWHKVAISAVVVFVAVLSFLLIKPALANEVEIDTKDSAFPMTHWMMMSMTSPGCHNAEDEAYTASFATKDEKQAAVWQRMQEKADQMDFYDWMDLFSDKISNTWASGANSYVLFMENCLHMDGIYAVVFGNHKDFMILYHQGMHILLLLGILFSCIWQIRQKEERHEGIFLLQLCLLGGFLFYLLWETGGQYSLVFFLLMVLLSLEGYQHLSEERAAFPYRLRLVNQESSVIETKGQKKDILAIAYSVAGFASILTLLIFLAGNADIFTKESTIYTDPVVNQLLANESVTLKDEVLLQSFRTNDSFNQIAFQWRNPMGGENDAVYEVTLQDMTGKEYWQQEIVASNQGYNGAFLYGFEQINPEGTTEYQLRIQKTAGSEENTLEFVTYSCGNYDVYPYGRLSMGDTVQSGDLLLQVTNQREATYTTGKRYFFFLGLCMIIFLFLEICCILQIGVPKDFMKKLMGKNNES